MRWEGAPVFEWSKRRLSGYNRAERQVSRSGACHFLRVCRTRREVTLIMITWLAAVLEFFGSALSFSEGQYW